MKQSTRIRTAALAALPTLLLIGACATTVPPVDVTRFHGNDVTREGNVSIVPADSRDADSLEFRATAEAVSAALTHAGYHVLDDGAGGADFRALVSLSRETIQPGVRRRSPVSVGVGGSTGSFGSGVGLGIGINLSGKPKPVVAMQLRVQIRRVQGDRAIWEGRAETAVKEGSFEAQQGTAAARLAEALFRDFPGPSGRTITVK